MKSKDNKNNKQLLAVKVLIRKAAQYGDGWGKTVRWFGTVRVDYGDIYDYRAAENDEYYTFCFDTQATKTKTAAKKLAKGFCDKYDLRVKRYVYD